MTTATNKFVGRITQVIGSTFDAEFPERPAAADLQCGQGQLRGKGNLHRPDWRDPAALGWRPRDAASHWAAPRACDAAWIAWTPVDR